jgi:hypothetical protein
MFCYSPEITDGKGKVFEFCTCYGPRPTKERDGTWRIKTNDELDKLIRHKNIINYIKAQKLSWFGRLHRMPEERMVKKLQVETDVKKTTRETNEQMGS